MRERWGSKNKILTTRIGVFRLIECQIMIVNSHCGSILDQDQSFKNLTIKKLPKLQLRRVTVWAESIPREVNITLWLIMFRLVLILLTFLEKMTVSVFVRRKS